MTTLDKMLQGLANALGASLSTLTTTAKTVVGAINELKSGLTSTNTTVSGHTSKIGSGSLNTTSQTLVGAVNELVSSSTYTVVGQNTFPEVPYTTTKTQALGTPKKNGVAALLIASDYLYSSDWGESNRNWISGATVIRRTTDSNGTVLFLTVTAGQTVYLKRSGTNTSLSATTYFYFLIT